MGWPEVVFRLGTIICIAAVGISFIRAMRD